MTTNGSAPRLDTFMHVRTSRNFDLVTPELVIPSQYPSLWFAQHPLQKPKATYTLGGVNEVDRAKAVLGGIGIHKLNVHLVKGFLHDIFSDVKGKLSEDWKSYGITIGTKDQYVSPWDIIEVTGEAGPISGTQSKDLHDEDSVWMTILLLSAHPLTGLAVPAYVDTLKEKVLNQMRLHGYRGGAFPPSALYETWVLDESYNKMIGAIDMFLTKFPNHEMSYMKVCTLRSRFKDCSGLLSVGYISKLLDLPKDSDFLDWLFTERLASEVIQMMQTGEETIQPHSYFPYQSDMKLVTKTYYSAVKNPQLYFLIHAVGSLLQSTRSQNAKYLSDTNIINNMQNAKIIAYVYSNTFAMEKAFARNGERIDEEEEVKESNIHQPGDTNAAAWFVFMRSNDFKLTPKMTAFVEKAKANMGETRADTIGDYVKRFF